MIPRATGEIRYQVTCGANGSQVRVADVEVRITCIERTCCDIFLNIAMRYLHRRRAERNAVPALD